MRGDKKLERCNEKNQPPKEFYECIKKYKIFKYRAHSEECMKDFTEKKKNIYIIEKNIKEGKKDFTEKEKVIYSIEQKIEEGKKDCDEQKKELEKTKDINRISLFYNNCLIKNSTEYKSFFEGLLGEVTPKTISDFYSIESIKGSMIKANAENLTAYAYVNEIIEKIDLKGKNNIPDDKVKNAIIETLNKMKDLVKENDQKESIKDNTTEKAQFRAIMFKLDKIQEIIKEEPLTKKELFKLLNEEGMYMQTVKTAISSAAALRGEPDWNEKKCKEDCNKDKCTELKFYNLCKMKCSKESIKECINIGTNAESNEGNCKEICTKDTCLSLEQYFVCKKICNSFIEKDFMSECIENGEKTVKNYKSFLKECIKNTEEKLNACVLNKLNMLTKSDTQN